MMSEDNVTSKISDERFAKLSKSYEQEQGEITAKLKIFKAELKKETNKMYSADMFLDIVQKYTDVQELTQRMVMELIDRIEIYHAERIDGIITQRVVIHYHCIGAFEVPDLESIPELDILIETKKGVALYYSPIEKAG